jgi:hypothetical protein
MPPYFCVVYDKKKRRAREAFEKSTDAIYRVCTELKLQGEGGQGNSLCLTRTYAFYIFF